ncbi:MAG: hypothetical protein ONB12_03450 [candidate division KSB1 bacterium]|nr:hypothetical protein [candidate division KSB1 bacterium]
MVINNNTYYDDNIVEMVYEDTSNSSEAFSVGDVSSAILNLTVTGVNETFETAVIMPYIGVSVSGTLEYVPLGVFYVDNVDRKKDVTKLTCYDGMIKLEKGYFSSLTYPATITAVMNEICTQAGIQFSGMLPNYSLQTKPEGYTLREMVALIASMCGGFAKFDRTGKLTIKSYTTITESVTADQYIEYAKKKDSVYRIDKVTCQVGDSTLSKGTLSAGGSEVTFENPFVTDAVLTDIYNKLNGFQYMPLYVKFNGNPALECGDIITFTTIDNQTYSIPIMSHRLTYSGGLIGEIESVGETQNSNQFSSSGSLAQKVDRVVYEQAIINDAIVNSLNATNARIDNLRVTTAMIDDLAVTTAKIADAAITNAKVANASIDNAKIANAAIGTAQIQTGAITNALVANAAIQTANIADASVTNAKIQDGAITNAKIANATIGTAQISDASITTAKIVDGSITNAKIANLAVDNAKIADASITSAKIQDGSITNAKIANATITGAKIANATITGANIANATITGAHIASATIDTANIKAGAITTALIGTGAVGTAQIADGSITDAKIVSLTANKITAGTINTGQVTIQGTNGKLKIAGNRLQVFDNQPTPVERISLGDVNGDGTVYGLKVRGSDGTTVLYDHNGVYSAGITDGAITNPKISSGAVDNRVIAVNAITADKIVAGTITGDKIASNTITANNIAANTITAGSAIIADGAITSVKIADASITSAKIANLAVGTAQIQDGAITNAKIANAAIDSAKIADAAITNAKIADLAVDNAKIANLHGSKITAGTVTADKLSVNSLSAISANLGTVTAGTIRGVTLESVTGTFSGQLTSAHLIIGPESPNIPWYDDSSLAVELKNPIRITDGVFDWGPSLFIKVGNSAAYFEGLNVTFENGLQVYGGLYNDGNITIGANAGHIQLVESDNNNKRWHIEVNNGAFNIVETNVAVRLQLTTGGGLIINWLNATGDINFSNYTGRLVNDSGYGYLQTTGSEYRVTQYKSTTYIPIRASSFPTGSLAEYKQDIHEWQESALEKIRSATIYEYRLKSEVEAGKNRWRQGLVIGDGFSTPEGVIDGDGVEQYLMNAWSWKAIQELADEVDRLKQAIEILKGDVSQ